MHEKSYHIFINFDNNVIWIVNDCYKNLQLLPKQVAQYLTEHMWMKLYGNKHTFLKVYLMYIIAEDKILTLFICNVISSGRTILSSLYNI